MLKQLAREVLPPILLRTLKTVQRTLRSSVDQAETKELTRLRELAAGQPAVTPLLGWPFHIVDGGEFAGLYETYFKRQLWRCSMSTERPFIIDCGAHIGVTVAWWKTAYPQARVLAFEADADNFGLLKQNVGHLTDVELRRAAVWSDDDEALFAVKGGDGGHLASLALGTDPAVVTKVPCVRLRSFLGQHVDLLKMDIEGAEIEVLRDCADVLRNVDRLFVEYHSFVGREQHLGRTISILEAAGFRLHAHIELPSPRPFEELLMYNEKDLRVDLFAFRDSVKPQVKRLES